MAAAKVHPKIQTLIDKIDAKRARAVIDHIVAHGHVTNEDLLKMGYNHPPRAARDVRECGVPLETFKVHDSNNRSIAAYRFGNPDDIEEHTLGGRKTFSKAFKKTLIERQGARDALTGERYEDRYLTIDHRVPYEVAGDAVAGEDDPNAFMLITGPSQRQKSWSCEHCKNWLEIKDPKICGRCYWASPEDYDHAEMEQRRRVTVVWVGQEIAAYEKIAIAAKKLGISVENYLKSIAE